MLRFLVYICISNSKSYRAVYLHNDAFILKIPDAHKVRHTFLARHCGFVCITLRAARSPIIIGNYFLKKLAVSNVHIYTMRCFQFSLHLVVGQTRTVVKFNCSSRKQDNNFQSF